MKTFIIAEAGVNHNGDLEIATKLIDVAVEAGADAVKFQTFKAERVVAKTASKAKYQIRNTGKDTSQFEMIRKLELSDTGFERLFNYCKEKNIVFMSTPFDEDSADWLDNLGMEMFKIPSGEITNKSLIQHIAAKIKPIILSTGMSYLGEVEKAIGWINEVWDKLEKRPQLTLLHSVSDYPAKMEDVNLNVIKTMATAFRLPVGYSDHTLGIEIPIAAVAMNARVIEKHFTLDRNMEGPDHKASLEPDELKAMVKAIRNVEKALGDGIKRPTRNEDDIRKVSRRSLVAARDIEEDETIALEDVAIKRPGAGILPEFKELIVGMQVKRNIKADTVIKWEDLRNA